MTTKPRATYDHTCPQCHKDFISVRENSKFCNSACYKASLKITIHKKKCQRCGQPFKTKFNQAKYCSRECAGVGKLNKQPGAITQEIKGCKVCPDCKNKTLKLLTEAEVCLNPKCRRVAE